MRKPVAMYPRTWYTEDGDETIVFVVLCDDGALFQMRTEPDAEGRWWSQLEPVPGTARDPAMIGYPSFQDRIEELLLDIARALGAKR